MKRIRKNSMLALGLLLATTGYGLAQQGEATYKAQCKMCHGETGAADTPAGKAMKVKAAKDPELLKMSEADMVTVTSNGKGKMPAYKAKLTPTQIKEAVAYFRGLQKK